MMFILENEKNYIPKQILLRGIKGYYPMEGNAAAALAGYSMSDTAFIYPITPSSPMGEFADEWSQNQQKNMFGNVTLIKTMQSEGGAAGAVHGAIATGSLTTTFTASQGLLLMMPNMYKIAGELLPTVFHVAARALSKGALSIYGDHSDVMAVRSTGFSFLSSGSVQESMDLGVISHLSTVKSRVPFCHFFDGMRLSHEINSIRKVSLEDMKKMTDFAKIDEHRKRGLNPEHPRIIGYGQGPNSYFQSEERANPFYNAVPQIVQNSMDDFYRIVGRRYNLFDYVGDPNAERVIVVMGCAGEVIEKVIDYLAKKGEKVGVIKVRLYRPFAKKEFLKVLPKTAKKIAVLDRTKESGAPGEPLYLDISTTLREEGINDPIVVGGRYGLSSREFNPSMIKAVFDNLNLKTPKNHFTVGINDDVTFLSIPINEQIRLIGPEVKQSIFFGLGGDGTVSANKTAIKIIVRETDLHGQGYFSYSADKSNAITRSYLRFGPKPKTSHYAVEIADFISCNKSNFVQKLDLLDKMKPGGVFLLNSPWTTQEEMEKNLPGNIKREIAKKNVKFYNIDAAKIARECNLGFFINMIMQTCFFKLSEVIPEKKAIKLLKKDIRHVYFKKGEKIVEDNLRAVDQSLLNLQEVHYDKEKWLNAPLPTIKKYGDPFVDEIVIPTLSFKTDNLPVSKFPIGGRQITGTSKYEKKGIAEFVPKWFPEKCIQCNSCGMVCPHSVCRPLLISKEEKEKAPPSFVTIPAQNRALKAYDFRIQISPLDCTLCELCCKACPADALKMTPIGELQDEIKNHEYSTTLSEKPPLVDIYTPLGCQLKKPLIEFPGSCYGCSETAFTKILTQLYGDRMIIANSSGCSSVWGAVYPRTPYCTNDKGHGPAWARSLFEDTSEFGYGMTVAMQRRREILRDRITELLKDTTVQLDDNFRVSLKNWAESFMDTNKSILYGNEIKEHLKQFKSTGKLSSHPLLEEIGKSDDILIKKSHWVIGGDGFAYDIGYGGLDWVIQTNAHVNFLILDSEVYSNTGGQCSGATNSGAVHKFSSHGKEQKKKNLALLAMTHGTCYVGTVALGSGAHFKHTLKVLKEAEAFPGPSIVLAYINCTLHGIKGGMSQGYKQFQLAVDSGYWPLFRFNPELKKQGKNPFILETKRPKFDLLEKFLESETRFSILKSVDPKTADLKLKKLRQLVEENFKKYQLLANENELIQSLQKKKK
ncbi:pyruvate-flavodoxin oxidoreductase-related [Anaeramoeba ignava]|uniref:Pyruvate-flavodoxin oxidoreductase-related n=1 Tax=Anaeramoeba ignava TaxID=1746090 RepID=A0A9Q0L8G4_ANAIG|nr:pyruvate-flavodoxin oxidoreductase-related [Anaeramoeba ignava]